MSRCVCVHEGPISISLFVIRVEAAVERVLYDCPIILYLVRNCCQVVAQHCTIVLFCRVSFVLLFSFFSCGSFIAGCKVLVLEKEYWSGSLFRESGSTSSLLQKMASQPKTLPYSYKLLTVLMFDLFRIFLEVRPFLRSIICTNTVLFYVFLLFLPFCQDPNPSLTHPIQ